VLIVCSVNNQEKFLKDFKAGQYAQAKLANILFSFELQRRWQGTWRHCSYCFTPLVKMICTYLPGFN
jgi:NAD(P)-dependent dehydrogenase (short-subunit alcohol dehydrogenase family)